MHPRHMIPHFMLALAASAALTSCGGGGSGSSPPTPPAPPPAGLLSAFAGDLGGEGNVNGSGAAARFSYPSAIAVDAAGNAYLTDSNNHSIRKVTPQGVVTHYAGGTGVGGSADGPAASARFFFPGGIAVDAAGTLFIADTNNHTIRRIAANGEVTTVAGTAGARGYADGTGAAARFASPTGIGVDAAGTLYVADGGNHVLRKITAAGVVSTLAGSAGVPGAVDGVGATARFATVRGLTIDAAGTLFVTDDTTQLIRRVTADGTVSTIAGAAFTVGSADGNGSAARFYYPSSIAASGGVLYVADFANHTIRAIDGAGVVTTIAGTAGSAGGVDGTGAAARFNAPIAAAAAPGGVLLVADYYGHTLRRVAPSRQVSTLAGTPARVGSTDGTGADARFFEPRGVAVDAAGNLIVADAENNTIRRITPAGEVVTIAGTAGTAGSADGIGAAARFDFPVAVAADAAGNVYVTDTLNHTIRKITPAGQVTTLAGLARTLGSSDGAGGAARFHGPSAVTVDRGGTIYVVDRSNHTIRRITGSGDVTTLAGAPGIAGAADGVGGAASFRLPEAIAADGAGNLYVTDLANFTVRKITPAGAVTTIAGSAGQRGSSDGVGPAARFSFPWGIAADSDGTLYVADGLSTIRRIAPDGSVTTIAGVPGQQGFVPGPLPGLMSPRGLALSGTSLYATMFNGVAVIRNRP